MQYHDKPFKSTNESTMYFVEYLNSIHEQLPEDYKWLAKSIMDEQKDMQYQRDGKFAAWILIGSIVLLVLLFVGDILL